jgi:hypothetical protein
VDAEAEAAKKKKELMDKEIQKVKDEFEEKQRKKKSKKSAKDDEKDKDKDEGDESKAEKERDDKVGIAIETYPILSLHILTSYRLRPSKREPMATTRQKIFLASTPCTGWFHSLPIH